MGQHISTEKKRSSTVKPTYRKTHTVILFAAQAFCLTFPPAPPKVLGMLLLLRGGGAARRRSGGLAQLPAYGLSNGLLECSHARPNSTQNEKRPPKNTRPEQSSQSRYSSCFVRTTAARRSANSRHGPITPHAHRRSSTLPRQQRRGPPSVAEAFGGHRARATRGRPNRASP